MMNASGLTERIASAASGYIKAMSSHESAETGRCLRFLHNSHWQTPVSPVSIWTPPRPGSALKSHCRDSTAYFWFSGRDDDVINTGGHLVGPFEIESALLEHEAVAESAAIGKPDPMNMEVVKVFVALRPGFAPSVDLELSIMNFVRKRLSPLAMPQEIEFVDKVPKTRSGKILRRVLKAKERGEPIGDISTMEDA